MQVSFVLVEVLMIVHTMLFCLHAAHPDSVNCVVFSSDGKTIASCCDDEIVRLFNFATGAPRVEILGTLF